MENNNDLISELIKKIKENKKYSSLSDEVIKKEIEIFSKKNKLSLEKSTIKILRKNLHKSYASFQTKKKSKSADFLLEELAEKIKNKKSLDETIKNLLCLTVSTKERIEDYPIIYHEIFSNFPHTKIIDLGCGLNPLSVLVMNQKPKKYFAYDIDEKDSKILNKFFKIILSLGIEGKSEILDLRNFKGIENLPEADLVFLFKVFDVIDVDNHKTSEEILKILKKKYPHLVVSFATKTITRRNMNFPKRKWFELTLERLGFSYKIFQTKNEIFYLIVS